MNYTEYDRTVDVCALEDAEMLISEAGQMLHNIVCRRPGYSELGAALVYLAKARDMIEMAIEVSL